MLEAKAWYESWKIDMYQLDDYLGFATENWLKLEYHFKSLEGLKNNISGINGKLKEYQKQWFDVSNFSIYYYDNTLDTLIKYN